MRRWNRGSKTLLMSVQERLKKQLFERPRQTRGENKSKYKTCGDRDEDIENIISERASWLRKRKDRHG